MLEFVIIADDLSGACDSAVQFSNYGYKTIVLNKLQYFKIVSSDYKVVSITTNSRELEVEEAKAKIQEACKFVKGHKEIQIYKKIDSTFRGNIGAELEVLIKELSLSFALVCSVYPENKRIGLGGYLLVDQKLLHHTEMAKDPGSPIADSYLPRLLANQTELPVEHVNLQTIEKGLEAVILFIQDKIKKGPCIIIADAVDKKHLDVLTGIGNEIKEPHILAGSAGLSASLLRQRSARNIKLSLPILIIVGSANPNNITQIDELLKSDDVKEIYISGEKFLDASNTLIEDLSNAAKIILAKGNHLVIRTCQSTTDVELAKAKGLEMGLNSKEVAFKISHGLQDVAAQILNHAKIAGMIITGGATLSEILGTVEGKGIEVSKEIETGVPLGFIVGGMLDGLPIITKAGGFGSSKVFCHGLEVLQEQYLLKGEDKIE